jgi:hypothetical protein
MNREFAMNTETGAFIRRSPVYEKKGRAFLASLGIHALIALIIIASVYLFPEKAIVITSSSGGGSGGDIASVGVEDEHSGGDASMTKPSLTPKPPALKEEAKPAITEKAIPLPNTLAPVRKRPEIKPNRNVKPVPETNVIPTQGEAGSGGAGGRSGGSGGGSGGGHGVSVGAGSGTGGFGNTMWAQRIEARISDNWHPELAGMRADRPAEMIFSFYIIGDASGAKIWGTIKNDKSSGNPNWDREALSAISNCRDLPAPPLEYRGRPLLFVARFAYPPR